MKNRGALWDITGTEAEKEMANGAVHQRKPEETDPQIRQKIRAVSLQQVKHSELAEKHQSCSIVSLVCCAAYFSLLCSRLRRQLWTCSTSEMFNLLPWCLRCLELWRGETCCCMLWILPESKLKISSSNMVLRTDFFHLLFSTPLFSQCSWNKALHTQKAIKQRKPYNLLYEFFRISPV